MEASYTQIIHDSFIFLLEDDRDFRNALSLWNVLEVVSNLFINLAE